MRPAIVDPYAVDLSAIALEVAAPDDVLDFALDLKTVLDQLDHAWSIEGSLEAGVLFALVERIHAGDEPATAVNRAMHVYRVAAERADAQWRADRARRQERHQAHLDQIHEEEAKALAIACPDCKQPPGSPCITIGKGHQKQFVHAIRRTRAQ